MFYRLEMQFGPQYTTWLTTWKLGSQLENPELCMTVPWTTAVSHADGNPKFFLICERTLASSRSDVTSVAFERRRSHLSVATWSCAMCRTQPILYMITQDMLLILSSEWVCPFGCIRNVNKPRLTREGSQVRDLIFDHFGPLPLHASVYSFKLLSAFLPTPSSTWFVHGLQ